jgi:hypothetical protein
MSRATHEHGQVSEDILERARQQACKQVVSRHPREFQRAFQARIRELTKS